MFSNLNQGDELVFQIHQNPNQEHQETIQKDHDTDQISQGGTKRQRNKSLSIAENIKDEDERRKKIMHREIERQRRQEMGKLHGSLRSLLPLEFIKGKRSISDHMQQAVSYINHLQGKIKELNGKKDKLDKSSSNIATGSSDLCLLSNYNYDDISVRVSPCLSGVEIIISGGLVEEGFPLSRVMEVLIEEGRFNVTSYASTKVNDRLLHTIQCEASDPTSINISELEQKLWDVIVS